MAKRTYLQDLSKTALHKRLVNAPCAEVRQLFMALSMRITRKALEAMYNDYNEHRLGLTHVEEPVVGLAENGRR